MTFTIYCHTHRDSKNRYVGQTRRTLRVRWCQLKGEARRGKEHPFYDAIREFGAEAFDGEILEQVSTLDGANESEIKWIAHYRSNETEFGYNVARGGNVGTQKTDGVRRTVAALAREAALSPEQKTARAMLGLAGLSPEERSEIARRREAKQPRKARVEKMAKAYVFARQAIARRPKKPRRLLLTPEQRRERVLAREARKTPEQRSEAVRKGHLKRSQAAKDAAVERMAVVNRGKRRKPKG